MKNERISAMKKRLYAICNTHLDPVWIWNRRSGRCAWLNTMHSVVRMMREFPELKFSCSAAALYRWVEETDPALFAAIAELVAARRWEIVGGWEVQSDAAISRPEPLLRQALSAKPYFREKFGVDVKIAYNVDAFGHNAGLPKILTACGFTHYVCMRTNAGTPPLFDWVADDGSRVAVLKIITYGTGGVCGDIPSEKRLFDEYFDCHVKSPLERQTLFFGLGDHGGGISRVQLEWLEEKRKNYDIVFSTLEEYFADVAGQPRPEISGELGPVFRGCYSNGREIKRKAARATRRLLTAEKLGVPAAELSGLWRELCFFHFHDILPGTSAREVFERDILPGLGGVESAADTLVDRELFRRSAGLDTRFMTQGGIYAWNPHPAPHRTIVSELDFPDPNVTGRNIDALRDAEGNEYPLQVLPPPTTFGPGGSAWGRLTAAVDLPPLGARTFAFAYAKRHFPALGFAAQRALLEKLSFEVFFDDTRTWGSRLKAFTTRLGAAERVSVTEWLDGPVCSILRSEWRYGNSTITLDLARYAGIAETGVRVQLDWHEVRCAVKLVCRHSLATPAFVTGNGATAVRHIGPDDYYARYEWVGGDLRTRHPESAEVSMIDWCASGGPAKSFAVYAPDLHSCDHAENALRITLIRPVLYADIDGFARNTQTGWNDLGWSERKLWIAELENTPFEALPGLAARRLHNGEACIVTAHAPGKTLPYCDLPVPPSLRGAVMEAYRRNEAGEYELRLRNPGGAAVTVELPPPLKTQTLPPYALRTFTWK